MNHMKTGVNTLSILRKLSKLNSSVLRRSARAEVQSILKTSDAIHIFFFWNTRFDLYTVKQLWRLSSVLISYSHWVYLSPYASLVSACIFVKVLCTGGLLDIQQRDSILWFPLADLIQGVTPNRIVCYLSRTYIHIGQYCNPSCTILRFSNHPLSSEFKEREKKKWKKEKDWFLLE